MEEEEVVEEDAVDLKDVVEDEEDEEEDVEEVVDALVGCGDACLFSISLSNFSNHVATFS